MGLDDFGGAGYAIPFYNATLLGSKAYDSVRGMGGSGGDLYSRQMVEQRRSEIDNFSQQLGLARQKYLASLGQMYNHAYSRFAGNAEAGFASRGLAVNGGAFASALARKTADYQAELEPQAFQAERQDLGTIDSARAGLFGSVFGADADERGIKYKENQANNRAIGQFAGTLIGAGIGSMAGPAGAGVGAKVGGQLGGGGGERGFVPSSIYEQPAYNSRLQSPDPYYGSFGASTNKLNLYGYAGR